jgi:uncharacterized phage infection (PIP) family protein YhgE
VGQGSSANFTNSTAIGAGATTTRDNQFILGTSSNTYTAPGITSGASLSQQQGSLQNGSIQIVTTDQSGNLATDGGAVFQNFANIDDKFVETDDRLNSLDNGLNQTNNRVDQLGNDLNQTNTNVQNLGNGLNQTNNRVDQLGNDLNQTNANVRDLGNGLNQTNQRVDRLDTGLNQANERIDNLNGRVDNLDNRITDTQEGIAMALAMSGVTPLEDYERVGINMNWGTFGGQNAFAMSAIVRLTPLKLLTAETVEAETSGDGEENKA